MYMSPLTYCVCVMSTHIDCIVVMEGRKKEADDAVVAEPCKEAQRAPGRQEIMQAVSEVLAEARRRRESENAENDNTPANEDDDDDEDMPDAEHEDEGVDVGGMGSAELFSALQASAINGSVEGLEEQLHNILNVLARFDAQARGANAGANRSSGGSGDEGADDEADDALAEAFRPPDPNPAFVEQLKDMGFPEPRVRKALILTRNSMTRATDWLLEHADDADIDTELTEAQLREIARNSFLTAQRLSRRFPGSGM